MVIHRTVFLSQFVRCARILIDAGNTDFEYEERELSEADGIKAAKPQQNVIINRSVVIHRAVFLSCISLIRYAPRHRLTAPDIAKTRHLQSYT